MGTASLSILLCFCTLFNIILSQLSRPYCDDRDDGESNHHYPLDEEGKSITSNYINTDFMGIPMSLVPGRCQSIDISGVGSQKWECENTDTLVHYEYSGKNCQSDDLIMEVIIYSYNTSIMYKNKNFYGGFSCDYDSNNFAKILFTSHIDNFTENFDLTIDADPDMDIATLYVAINICGATDNTMTEYTKLNCCNFILMSISKPLSNQFGDVWFCIISSVTDCIVQSKIIKVQRKVQKNWRILIDITENFNFIHLVLMRLMNVKEVNLIRNWLLMMLVPFCDLIV